MARVKSVKMNYLQMKSNLERKLRLFAEYLKSEQVYQDPYVGGVVERAVNYAKEETIQRIGEYLEEVLDMTDEQLDKEDKIIE